MHKRIKDSQVTLELAFTLSLIVLLFWAAAQSFLYVNNRLIIRQQYYESSEDMGRQIAADVDTEDEIQVRERDLPELDFFRVFGF